MFWGLKGVGRVGEAVGFGEFSVGFLLGMKMVGVHQVYKLGSGKLTVSILEEVDGEKEKVGLRRFRSAEVGLFGGVSG